MLISRTTDSGRYGATYPNSIGYVRVITTADREWLIDAFKDRNFTRRRKREGDRVKIFYSPETDSLSIKLRTGDDRVLGEIMGEDLNENVILHRDGAGALYEIEVVGSASKVFDLERLEVEGLPVNVSLAKSGQQESKAG